MLDIPHLCTNQGVEFIMGFSFFNKNWPRVRVEPVIISLAAMSVNHLA